MMRGEVYASVGNKVAMKRVVCILGFPPRVYVCMSVFRLKSQVVNMTVLRELNEAFEELFHREESRCRIKIETTSGKAGAST